MAVIYRSCGFPGTVVRGILNYPSMPADLWFSLAIAPLFLLAMPASGQVVPLICTAYLSGVFDKVLFVGSTRLITAPGSIVLFALLKGSW